MFSVLCFLLLVFVICLVYPMFPISLDCPCFIAPVVLASVYSNICTHTEMLLTIITIESSI